jgi:hypothetical protein
MLANAEDTKLPKRTGRRAIEADDLETVLSDPEIRAALRDIMAGLTEALNRIDRLERDKATQKPALSAADSGSGSDTRDSS